MENPKFQRTKRRINEQYREEAHPEDFPCNHCSKESLCKSAWGLQFWMENCPYHKWNREENIDKFERAITHLCDQLDTMLYLPFKKWLISSSIGRAKERYKKVIVQTITQLKEGENMGTQKEGD